MSNSAHTHGTHARRPYRRNQRRGPALMIAPGRELLRKAHGLLYKIITCPHCKGWSATQGLYTDPANPRVFYSVNGQFCATCQNTGSVRYVPKGHPDAGTIGET